MDLLRTTDCITRVGKHFTFKGKSHLSRQVDRSLHQHPTHSVELGAVKIFRPAKGKLKQTERLLIDASC